MRSSGIEYIHIYSEFNIPCSFSGEGDFCLNYWEMNCTVNMSISHPPTANVSRNNHLALSTHPLSCLSELVDQELQYLFVTPTVANKNSYPTYLVYALGVGNMYCTVKKSRTTKL